MPTAEGEAVTFVIPTRDRARLLVECLGSIAAQTEGGWSVMVVDDASSDGTEAAVRDLALPSLRYLRNPARRGAAESRNRGVAESSSPLIAFVDSDDRLHPDYLARVRRLFREEPRADLVCCDSAVIDAEGRGRPAGRSFQTREAQRKRYLLRTGFRSFEDIFVFSTTFPGTALRRSAFLRTAGFPDWAFPMEDVALQLQVAALGLGVYYLGEVLADYRVHDENASTGPGRDAAACRKKVEVLSACARLAPPGTRRSALRRRLADTRFELAIALWWSDHYGESALQALRALGAQPMVGWPFVRDRIARLRHGRPEAP